MDFKTVITDDGAAVLNAATASKKINLTTFAVGIGTATKPLNEMDALENEKYRASISEIIPSPDHVAFKCVIPPDVESITEDLTIKELGIYDDNGEMCVYSVVPDTLRPVSSSGAGTETIITVLVKFQGSKVSVNVKPDATATKSDFSTLVEKYQVPVGAIVPFQSATAPAGWLLCNGATIQKSVYPDLVKHLNGGDEDAVSANLPNLLGEFVRGWSGNQNGAPDAGRVLGSKQADDFKSHSHGLPTDHPYGSGQDMYSIVGSPGADEGMSEAHRTANFGGAETRPRNVALAYYIKAYGEVTDSASVDLNSVVSQYNNLVNADLLAAQKSSFECLKEETGYQKLEGGLIMQWGRVSVAYNQTITSVDFPMTFPSSCLNVQSTVKHAAAVNGTWNCYVCNQTTTGFEILGEYDSGAGTSEAYWFAIGY